MLDVLGTVSAAAHTQGEAMDTEQMSDYVDALRRVVGDALAVAEAIDDGCIVVPCSSTGTFHRADTLRREAMEQHSQH
jgi:hypothetical protein